MRALRATLTSGWGRSLTDAVALVFLAATLLMTPLPGGTAAGASSVLCSPGGTQSIPPGDDPLAPDGSSPGHCTHCAPCGGGMPMPLSAAPNTWPGSPEAPALVAMPGQPDKPGPRLAAHSRAPPTG